MCEVGEKQSISDWGFWVDDFEIFYQSVVKKVLKKIIQNRQFQISNPLVAVLCN